MLVVRRLGDLRWPRRAPAGAGRAHGPGLSSRERLPALTCHKSLTPTMPGCLIPALAPLRRPTVWGSEDSALPDPTDLLERHHRLHHASNLCSAPAVDHPKFAATWLLYPSHLASRGIDRNVGNRFRGRKAIQAAPTRGRTVHARSGPQHIQIRPRLKLPRARCPCSPH